MSTHRLQDLTTAHLAEAANENFVVHASWAHCHIPSAMVIDNGRLLVADLGLPCDTFKAIPNNQLPISLGCNPLLTARSGLSHWDSNFWIGLTLSC